jgi:transposase InsO family protein
MVVKFAIKHNNNSEAARKYGVSRQRVGVWRKRYDGTLESLLPHSTRPKSNPRQCAVNEIELVLRVWRHCGRYGLDYVYGLLVRKQGFQRERTTVYNILKRNGYFKKKKDPLKKRKSKEYHGAKVPGQKLQMDVKYVPKECMPQKLVSAGVKWYQWTIIDEATNLRYTQFYDDKANMNSVKFVSEARKFFPFKLQEIQTDNGTEFTNKFLNTPKLSSFEKYTRLAKIRHKLIRPATPRHNGRVERSHRTDGKFFYKGELFESLEDCRTKGRKWLNEYNRMYLRKFGYLSPMEVWSIYEKHRKPLTPKFIASFNPRQGLAQAA